MLWHIIRKGEYTDVSGNKDKQLTIRFEKELFDRLRLCAEADDRTVASLIRHLARQHVTAETDLSPAEVRPDRSARDSA